MIIYEFLKIILINEYKNISQKNIKICGDESVAVVKDKKKKIRRKNITIEIQNP